MDDGDNGSKVIADDNEDAVIVGDSFFQEEQQQHPEQYSFPSSGLLDNDEGQHDPNMPSTSGLGQGMRMSAAAVASSHHLAWMEGGRKYYLHHGTQTTSWVPSLEEWNCQLALPYGWEMAIDTTGKPYYINHVMELTTYHDPRAELDYELIEPRRVTIQRDPNKGFGFVAGSEKPVLIRYVTPDGPSSDKLLPADEILCVNDENVEQATKDHVVKLVKNSGDVMELTVCQPRLSDSSLKSAILSAAKRARLKSAPSRVRFAEGVQLGTPPTTLNGANSMLINNNSMHTE